MLVITCDGHCWLRRKRGHFTLPAHMCADESTYLGGGGSTGDRGSMEVDGDANSAQEGALGKCRKGVQAPMGRTILPESKIMRNPIHAIAKALPGRWEQQDVQRMMSGTEGKEVDTLVREAADILGLSVSMWQIQIAHPATWRMGAAAHQTIKAAGGKIRFDIGIIQYLDCDGKPIHFEPLAYTPDYRPEPVRHAATTTEGGGRMRDLLLTKEGIGCPVCARKAGGCHAGRTYKFYSGLIGHMVKVHPGEALRKEEADFLQHINRRVCTRCQSLRDKQSRVCYACGTRTAAMRAVRAGYTIVRYGGTEPAEIEGSEENAAQEPQDGVEDGIGQTDGRGGAGGASSAGDAQQAPRCEAGGLRSISRGGHPEPGGEEGNRSRGSRSGSRLQGHHPLPGLTPQQVPHPPERTSPGEPPAVTEWPRGIHRYSSLSRITPADIQRAEELPTPALVHIPVSCRAPVAMAWATILEHSSEGRAAGEDAARIFFRILGQAIPYGTPAHFEVNARLDRWIKSDIGGLLDLVENRVELEKRFYPGIVAIQVMTIIRVGIGAPFGWYKKEHTPNHSRRWLETCTTMTQKGRKRRPLNSYPIREQVTRQHGQPVRRPTCE